MFKIKSFSDASWLLLKSSFIVTLCILRILGGTQSLLIKLYFNVYYILLDQKTPNVFWFK